MEGSVRARMAQCVLAPINFSIDVHSACLGGTPVFGWHSAYFGWHSACLGGTARVQEALCAFGWHCVFG